ncbi:MAG: formylmethanofuran dehydrogenase subunit E family protein [Thermoplasmata archaeon]|nr:MAG: formylmethanofuran dehydrogenase subunit E family protein [Thermoplasmata archaeon]
MEYDLPSLAKWFHGHYQPYIALGIRMGELAMELLEANRHELQIVSETGFRPTYSCMTDGLQLVTGSTVGNGKLKMLEKGALAATFSKDDKKLRIESKDFKFNMDFITEVKPEELFMWEWK